MLTTFDLWKGRGRRHDLWFWFFEKVRPFTPFDLRSGIRSMSSIRPICKCRCPALLGVQTPNKGCNRYSWPCQHWVHINPPSYTTVPDTGHSREVSDKDGGMAQMIQEHNRYSWPFRLNSIWKKQSLGYFFHLKTLYYLQSHYVLHTTTYFVYIFSCTEHFILSFLMSFSFNFYLCTIPYFYFLNQSILLK